MWRFVVTLGCAAALRGSAAPRRRVQPAASAAVDVEDVRACLDREYRSFFDPLEAAFYLPDVSFDDPLSSLAGLEAYRKNIDMLAGRNALGRVLFSDASINLHSCEVLGPVRLRTRWMLQMTFNALPWKPTARFTGVSEYDLDATTLKIKAQTDYWDSIDLADGAYKRSSVTAGARDFAAQLAIGKADWGPSQELLRRSRDYSVFLRNGRVVAMARTKPGDASATANLRASLARDGLAGGEKALSSADDLVALDLATPHPWEAYALA
ncbi:hypothetical protein M885DRAFT_464775 [Pelagophyceae sp. CCMP2097]|nr:hypothetical protein M885DRAFT_464775 [Pelagophyceae sp. CCMP2097]